MNYNLLKHYRQSYNLSQKQVCGGICSPTSYSRFESGSGETDFFTAEALLERLGKNSCDYDIVMDSREFSLFRLRHDIKADILAERPEAAAEKLSEYERIMPEPRSLHQQFVLFSRAQICQGQPEEEALLWDAWSRTKASRSLSDEELYRPLEIRILLRLIHLESEAWDMTDILQQLDLLYEKINTYFTGIESDELRSLCLWEIICQGEKQWDSHLLLAKIDETIRMLTPWWSFRLTADFHRKRAEVLARLMERPGDNAALREQCILECRMVYFIYETMRRDEKQRDIVQYCLEKTGADITDPLPSPRISIRSPQQAPYPPA